MYWTLKVQGYWGHFFEVAECPQTTLKLMGLEGMQRHAELFWSEDHKVTCFFLLHYFIELFRLYI